MRTRLTLVSGLTGGEMDTVMGAIQADGLEAIASQPGYLGYAVFGNPDSGRGGLATGWTDEDTLKRSFDAHADLRATAIGAIGYRRTPSLEDYDVLTWSVPPMDPQHRQGVHLRLGRVTGLSLADLAPVREAIQEAWLPQLNALPGFLGYAILGNTANGTGGMATLWATRMALSRSTDAEHEVYRSAAKATVGHAAERTIDRFEMFEWDVPLMPAHLSGRASSA